MSRLLLAIDLADLHRDLVTRAAAWAERLGARLDLLYVGRYHEVDRLVFDPTVHDLLAAAAEQSKAADARVLVEILREVPEAVRGDGIIEEGVPARRIVELQDPYDAIFIGTHGRTGISHTWIGSVAERVVRTASRPVVVFRCEVEPAHRR